MAGSMQSKGLTTSPTTTLPHHNELELGELENNGCSEELTNPCGIKESRIFKYAAEGPCSRNEISYSQIPVEHRQVGNAAIADYNSELHDCFSPISGKYRHPPNTNTNFPVYNVSNFAPNAAMVNANANAFGMKPLGASYNSIYSNGNPPSRVARSTSNLCTYPGNSMKLDTENRFSCVQLDDVVGQLATLAKDQHGCRFLQRKLDEGTSATATKILEEVLGRFSELMVDPFGNYLCQKLLDYATETQKTTILQCVAPDLVPISLNMHGTRAVQKLVEHISSPTQIQLLIYALARHTVTLVKDLNGNHVVQKCLVRLSPSEAQFIFDSVTANCVEVATHRHGCCVLQRCLDYASTDARRKLAAEVTGNCLQLVKDPFGNYVVQYVLDMGDHGFIDAIGARLLGHVPVLSMQKFASNVVEKCLRVASSDIRRALIIELYSREVLQRLLRDAYANYVVQTSIDFADQGQRALLLDCLGPLVPLIRNTPYGKRIMSKLSVLA
jgi:hypothetical protein